MSTASDANSATDADLRTAAERDLSEAITMLGMPAVVGGWDVGGDDYWDQFAKRAGKALDLAKKARPMQLGADAARRIRDAAKRGLDKASQASDAAKVALGSVATAAGMAALGPGILLGLIAFAVIEGSGYGRRARAGARRYVSARAREYGI